MKLWFDLETFSPVPIKHGTHRYAANAEVMLAPWAVDDEEVRVWDATDGSEMPVQLLEALLLADEIWAHNSHFDRTQLSHAFPELDLPVHRWRDTMVQALAHSLPGSLGDLSEVFNLGSDTAKDSRGKKLIRMFCMPVKGQRNTSKTHPVEWAEFVEYARLDVVAMRTLHKRMPMWNYQGRELDLWHLDQKINDRGILVDVALAKAALNCVDAAQIHLKAEAQALTGYTEQIIAGARGGKTVASVSGIESAAQGAKLRAYLFAVHGYYMDNLQGSTVDAALSDPRASEEVKQILRVRAQSSTTSTSKYQALLNAVSRDDRMRGLLQFCGASRTGRWAGRTFQPHNLPRPTMKQAEIDFGIKAIKAGAADLVCDDVMAVASNALRGCLVAPKGRKLVISDLSNIEGRALAWLSGEEWKLDAFRAFDAGVGPDLYKLAYAKSFGIDAGAVNKAQRQVGKVQELALGYQGGVGAFVTFAAAYNIDLEALAGQVLSVAGPGVVETARKFHEWLLEKPGGQTYGLSPDAFVACDVIKRGWRTAHTSTVAWWGQLELAFRSATLKPGVVYPAGTVSMYRQGAWLRVILPSGRVLCYPAPRLIPEVQAPADDTVLDDIILTTTRKHEPKVEGRTVCSFAGTNPLSRKWSRTKTYSGKLAENITQAFARDILAANMGAIEAAGYEIVMSIHDEFLTETPDSDDYSHEQLSALMSTVPAWAEGLPLAAAGFETHRYRKDD